MKQLKTLYLADAQITGSGMKYIGQLTNLENLSLGTNEVMDSGVEHLRTLEKLTTLDLSETRITDAGMEHLEGLTNLEELRVERSQVTETRAREFLESMSPPSHPHKHAYIMMTLDSGEVEYVRKQR